MACWLTWAFLPTYFQQINYVSRLLLRRVYESEQTDELRGISEQTEIPMYLLVSLNVILDLLMGCTSGGVRSLERGQLHTQSKMLHFRILDWGMDGLRDIIVQLDYIKSKSSQPGDIVASNITYVGFVGCLTGVRRGRSISLNFRAVHDGSTWMKHLSFYCHHSLVLLGWQPSMGSVLRSYLLCDDARDLSACVENFCSQRTTAAYVVFSDGQKSVIVEKDLSHAELRESDTFIAVTNHDATIDRSLPSKSAINRAQTAVDPLKDVAGMADIITESEDRLNCIEQKWRTRAQSRQRGSTRSTPVSASHFITQRVLRSWLRDWPTSNECTHFAAIMDSEAGKVTWSEVYLMRQDPNLHLPG